VHPLDPIRLRDLFPAARREERLLMTAERAVAMSARAPEVIRVIEACPQPKGSKRGKRPTR
jgi:hypothetical protein